MKKMKKVMCLLLAFVLVLGMSMTVFADEGNEADEDENPTFTVTIEDKEGVTKDHTFTAYQIFKGTQGDAENILGDVEWGDGINSTQFLTDLQGNGAFGTGEDNLFAKAESAADVAEVLSGLTSAQVEEVANIALKNIAGAGKGLTDLPAGYYLIVDSTEVDGKNEVANAALLQATRNVTIAPKVDRPQSEKKVKEGGANGTEGDVADYSIGDHVPFVFHSKVPNMDQYDPYYYAFHDTMDAGLTFDGEDSVTVKIGEQTIDAGNYRVVFPGSDCTFEVIFDNLKSVDGIKADEEIVIEFTATLNPNAKVGSAEGNKNTMHLEFSNDPTDKDSHGNTPDDSVIVFTYELDVTKVDGKDKDKTLEGAEFVLYRVVGSDKEYAIVNEDGKITEWTKDYETAKNSPLTSDAKGLFKVAGLDAGTYYLEETKAPAGYNKLTGPVEIVISATKSSDEVENLTDLLEDLKITVGEQTTDGDVSTGIVGTKVENNQGSSLPETGGIGTTIFYVLGGILVVCCGVILVTRKRVSR